MTHEISLLKLQMQMTKNRSFLETQPHEELRQEFLKTIRFVSNNQKGKTIRKELAGK